MVERFTFAVIGHDEGSTLRYVLDQALAATRPGDCVWFVDSASTDDSRSIAQAAGVEVLTAPLGKGRAVQTALDRCREGVLCLVDADIQYSEHNIPLRLREAMEHEDVDLLLGDYQQPTRRRVVTSAIFRPLAAALFPAVADLHRPLSGFRALRAGMNLAPVPAGYGVETHLDIQVHLMGGRIGVCNLGRYQGPLRDYVHSPAMSADVAAAILDLATEHGLLHPSARPAWNAWVDDVIALVRTQPPPGAADSAFLLRLTEVSARPLPPTGVADSQLPAVRSDRLGSQRA